MRGAILLAAVALAGCEARVSVDSKPAIAMPMTSASGVKLTNVYEFPGPQAKGTIMVKEICYDGVVYLVTSEGGITVKARVEATDSSINYSPAPFVRCVAQK